MCYCPTPTLHLNLALTGDGAFLFSLKKTHSVWFISVLNYGDTENVLINHLLLVIPMSYPCHYTNLCPHKPHKHAHTHTHTHTHTMQPHSLSVSIAEVNQFNSFSQQKRRGRVRSFAFHWKAVFSYTVFALSSQKSAWSQGTRAPKGQNNESHNSRYELTTSIWRPVGCHVFTLWGVETFAKSFVSDRVPEVKNTASESVLTVIRSPAESRLVLICPPRYN